MTKREPKGLLGLGSVLLVVSLMLWAALDTGCAARPGAGVVTPEQIAACADLPEQAAIECRVQVAARAQECASYADAALAWKGLAVAGSAITGAAGGATALVEGIADPNEAEDWTLGLGITTAVGGGLTLLGTLMAGENDSRYDARCVADTLWMPEAKPMLPDLAPSLPAVEVAPEPAPAPEPAAPAAAASEAPSGASEAPSGASEAPSGASDLPGPEGTGTGSDGLADDAALAAPGVP